MMRFAWVILLLAGVGAGTVHVRVQQNRVRAETQRLEARRLQVRRTLWEQQSRLGQVTSPGQVQSRGRDMALELVGPEDVLETGRQTVQRGR